MAASMDEAELVLWLDNIDQSMGFRPASAIAMSCGTVTLDLPNAMALVVWNNRLKLYQLPKGRRNIDESMLDAALRETYEETGLHVTPLQLKIATRATPVRTERPSNVKRNPDITEDCPSTEFIGACLYPDPQSQTEALKIVYYFAATADCTATRDSGAQEEWEKLDAEWIPLSRIPTTLRFQAEIETVMKAVADVERSGYTIGA